MSWLDRLIGRVTPVPASTGAHLHHEPLERTAAFLERSATLRQGPGWEALLDRLAAGWQQAKAGIPGHFTHLSGDKASGVIFERPEGTDEDRFRCLLDDLKDRVLALGYRLQLADRRITSKGSHHDRYYLKPAITSMRPPIDQRYGNILLEQWGENGRADHMKVLLTVYQDRLYGPPEEASELLDKLFPA